MSSLGLTITLYALALAVLLAASAVRGKPRPALLSTSLLVLEAGVIAQAALDGLSLLRGDHGSEVAVNVGYLLTSLAVLPVTASVLQLDPGRWGNVGLCVGCLLLAVVVIRLQTTLHSG